MAFKLFVDLNGVPYSEYGVYKGVDIGRQRSILAVAECGLWYSSSPITLLSYQWGSVWPVNRDELHHIHPEKKFACY